jgi:hypothetical protein
MVCLIGLFAMGSGANQLAVGPLILMIIFLIFVILYHISMNSAMEPLLNFLPKNLEAEEESLLAAERNSITKATSDDLSAPTSSTGVPRDSGVNVDGIDKGLDSAEKGLTDTPASEPKPNFLTKFLRPDKYASYHQLRKLVPTADPTTYPLEAERDAYCHPSITSQPPLLWIPRDPLGVSSQEVAHTMRVIPITDEDAYLDEKCKIQWNVAKGEPPIYEEKPAY